MTVTYISTLPSTTSTVTVPIPSTGSAAQPDWAMAVQNLVRAGGIWVTSATGVLTWIPYGEITLITVQ
jgi:hypothetical protein